MKGDNVDAYIAGFEQLARRAGYTTESPETEQLFLQGLPHEILKDVKRALASGNDVRAARTTQKAGEVAPEQSGDEAGERRR